MDYCSRFLQASALAALFSNPEARAWWAANVPTLRPFRFGPARMLAAEALSGRRIADGVKLGVWPLAVSRRVNLGVRETWWCKALVRDWQDRSLSAHAVRPVPNEALAP